MSKMQRKRIDLRNDRISPFFGEMIRQRREDLGYSQQCVADRIGCCPATVHRHEKGAAFLPRPHLFEGFATVLELSQDDMWRAAYYAQQELRLVA